jgi:hypothetical protein
MTRASEADELADDRYRRVDPVALITPVPDNAERARNSVVFASFAHKIGFHCRCGPCEHRVAPWSAHSHSIVAGTYNRLKITGLLLGVRQTYRQIYRKNNPLGGDRRPKGLRILQLLLQPHLDQRLIRHISRVGS